MPCKRFALALLTALISFSAFAQDDESDKGFFNNPGPKAERNYVSFGISLNEFNKLFLGLVRSSEVRHERLSEGPIVSSEVGLTAQTYGASLIFGNYIDNTFRTEFRYGEGIKYDSLKGAKDVQLDYWFSMLIGADQDITDYMRAYAMLGASYFQADVKNREVEREIEIEGIRERTILQPSVYSGSPRIFTTDFSFTWLIGLDYKLSDQWYLSFEYGLLVNDSDIEVEVDQYSTYLKFEF